MENVITPGTPEEVLDAVAEALAEGTRLEVIGAGTKRNYGRPAEAERTLGLSRLAGITMYEPNELVMTARPGTPLGEIEASLDKNGQQLAFEPADYGPLLAGAALLEGAEGREKAGGATIGGIFACNLSGPRRIAAGAARDHILGIKAVSGRAEAFKSGGRVVKNVTGYDMSKLLTGEHGVGVEKRDLMGEMFNEDDLKHQQRLKCAFDPKSLLNPGKMFPILHRCAELGRVHIHRGRTRHPDLPRF